MPAAPFQGGIRRFPHQTREAIRGRTQEPAKRAGIEATSRRIRARLRKAGEAFRQLRNLPVHERTLHAARTAASLCDSIQTPLRVITSERARQLASWVAYPLPSKRVGRSSLRCPTICNAPSVIVWDFLGGLPFAVQKGGPLLSPMPNNLQRSFCNCLGLPGWPTLCRPKGWAAPLFPSRMSLLPVISTRGWRIFLLSAMIPTRIIYLYSYNTKSSWVAYPLPSKRVGHSSP